MRRARNVSEDNERFKISAQDYLQASELGDIKAIYHSHPSTKPSFSEFDKFNSISHNLIYVLYSMKDNSFTQFDPSLTEFNKYIGREFKIGKTDCYSLIKDFYESELNIQLSEYHRDKDFRSNLEDLFDKHFGKEGFYKADELQKYDCILFGRGKDSLSNHIALYLGGNLMLQKRIKHKS